MRLLECSPGLSRRLREAVRALVHPRHAAWRLRSPSFTASCVDKQPEPPACRGAPTNLSGAWAELCLSLVASTGTVGAKIPRLAFSLSRTTPRASITPDSADRDQCPGERRAINARPRPLRVKGSVAWALASGLYLAKQFLTRGFYLILPT